METLGAMNPFTPAFGRVPPYMAGREQIISDMLRAFEGPGGDPNLSTLFLGARGTGKTALLSYLGSEARSRGWITVDVSAVPGMLEDAFQQAQTQVDELLGQEDKRRLSHVEVAHLGALSWESPVPVVGNWRTRMNGLFERLAPVGTGILITVDEAKPSLGEMVSLVTTYQHFVRENRRAALLMAGLPHNVSGLLSGSSTSFMRRAFRHNLGSIPPYEVEEAFRMTLGQAGRSIEPDALARAVDAIGGFPFMLQLVGYRTFNAAGGRAIINMDDVTAGIRLAQAELKDRVFDATLAELSKGDAAFLQAMLVDDGPSARSDLVERLGKGTSHVSTYKKRLLEAGVIEEPRNGVFTFALPGFREYLVEELG